jgi:hypothetical protein
MLTKGARLFNMDLHISVIADFKNLFPEFNIIEWCMSGHSWVFNKKRAYPDIINPSTWIKIDDKMIELFQQKYDSLLSSFDGFICGHPNGFALLFEKYNKPIIIINSCRYDLPFCWSHNHDMLMKYNSCLIRLRDRGLLIAVSNNRADQLYIQLGAGIITKHIPSLCAYTDIKYRPEFNKFLCYHGELPDHPLIYKKSALPKPFKWSDLGRFKGIIHLPYEISTMSMFEHFTAGIPLFFPSKEYMMKNCVIQSVGAYWKDKLPESLAIFRKKDTWIDLADFYCVFESPNVYYFDSDTHLFSLLESFEWKDDSIVMMRHRSRIRSDWEELLRPYGF